MLVEMIDGETPSQRLAEKAAREFVKTTRNVPIKNKSNVDEVCLHLVRRCLEYNADRRITVVELLMVNSLINTLRLSN